MPLTPIQGASQFFSGANSVYTNSTPGGAWSSGNVSVATINAATGVATGVAEGNTQIVYTISGNSTALNISVKSKGRIANGFNPTAVLSALKREVLWPSQGQSNSGRYFTDFHPLASEEILLGLSSTGDIAFADYLSSLNDAVILECVNLVCNEPQLIDKSKLIFSRTESALATQEIQSNNEFVGVLWEILPGDYGIKISNLMLFFTEDVTFTMCLYDDFSLPPKYQIEVSALAYQQVAVNLQNNAILNYLSPSDNKGGTWRFGYYQSDLGSAQAINYPVVNNCFKICKAYSFSAPVITDVLGNRNFDRGAKSRNQNITYGLNLEMSTMIDATNDIVNNSSLWGNLIGLKMITRLVEIYKYSLRSNIVERAIQENGGVDELNTLVNGRPYNYMTGVAKVTGLISMVNDAAKAVKQGFRPISPL